MAVYLGNQKKRIKKMPIIIGLVVLLIGISAGVFFFFGTNDETTQQPETTETVESTTGTLPSNAFPITVVNE